MNRLELQAMLKRGGARVVGEETPALPERADATLLGHVQHLAKQHGWLGQHTAAGDSEDDLECLLVREVLIYAFLKPDQGKVTPRQLAWIDVLRDTKAIEVHVWRPVDLSTMTERLARKRARHG